MWILIDLVILAIIGICIFFGYKKGLIGVAFKIVSFIVALLIAFIIFQPVSNFIVKNTEIDDKIKEMVMERVVVQEAESKEVQDGSTSISGYVQSSLKGVAEDAKTAAVIAVSDQITMLVINVLVFLLVYLITRVIMFFLKGILEFIANLPIIKQFDKVGGFIYGILKGFVIVYFIFAIISIASISSLQGIVEMINKSILGSMMYNNNLILVVFFNNMK